MRHRLVTADAARISQQIEAEIAVTAERVGVVVDTFDLRVGFALGLVRERPDEAMRLRNHILSCLEHAARSKGEAERRAWLTFVVAGGGPTGVEFTGALEELLRLVLGRDYPELQPDQSQIMLVEGLDQLLMQFPKPLGKYALRTLTKRGVDVRLRRARERADDRRLGGGAPLDAARAWPPTFAQANAADQSAVLLAIRNARAFLDIRAEHGSFDAWIWRFVGGEPIAGNRRGRADMPARTPLSDALSKELKRRGFSFVGSTIVYAFMQAAGLVNDHTRSCFRRP